MSTVPKDNELVQSIYKYFKSIGQEDSAKAIAKANNIDTKKLKLDNIIDISVVYQSSKKRPNESANGNASKKSKQEEDDSESDSDDSDDDDEPVKQPVKTTTTVVKTTKPDSDSDDSDSDSDDEPVKAVAKPASKPVATTKSNPKDNIEDDSDDSDSDSDSDESSKAQPSKTIPSKPAAVIVKKPVAKDDSSDSDSDSSSSSSEDEPVKPVAKKAPTPAVKKPSSSSESSSSDEEDEEVEEKPVVKKPVAPAKSQPVTPNKPAESNENDGKEYKIYVKGLPWSAKQKDVENFFKSSGKIVSVECPNDENGRSSGTAYVRFASRKDLDEALKLDGQIWPGTERWLKIIESTDSGRKSFGTATQAPGVRPEGCNTVFIGNLSWEVTEEIIRETFEKFGEVTQVRFAMDEEGSFKGFGHVEFADGDSTVEAVKVHGTTISGRAIRVDYAPPRNRESTGGGRGRGGGDRGGRGGSGGGGRFGGGGRSGGRSNSSTPTFNKNKGTIASNTSASKKTTFDD
eukprot:gene20296-26347_t